MEGSKTLCAMMMRREDRYLSSLPQTPLLSRRCLERRVVAVGSLRAAPPPIQVKQEGQVVTGSKGLVEKGGAEGVVVAASRGY
jgi:hypothetical protein